MEDVTKIQKLFGSRKFSGPSLKMIVICLAGPAVFFAIALAIPTSRACLLEMKAAYELAAGNRTSAIDDLTNAVDADPSNFHILKRRAQALEDYNETGGAIIDYQKLLKVPSEQITALSHLSQLYTKTANFTPAEECCDRWIDLAPKSGAAYHAKARLCEAEHKFDQAKTLYEKSLLFDGGLPARLDRDSLLEKLQFGTADELVEPTMVNRDGDYDSLVYDAIVAGTSRNDNKLAFEKLNKASKLDPQRPDAYEMRGSLHAALGQYREAILDFQIGERLHSKQPPDSQPKEPVLMSAAGLYKAGEVFMWAGISYNAIADYRNAIAEFDKAIAFSPSPKMYRLRAKTYANMGDDERSRADLKTAKTAIDRYDLSGAFNSAIDYR